MSASAGALALGLALAVSFALGSCGGGSSAPSTPSTPVPSATPPPGGAATVTIAAGAVNPKQVEINVGQRVAFVNNDTVPHEIHSNPHPIHTDCPPLNEIGALGPGQGGITGAFTIARTCGYHDHGQPDNTSLQGTIIIH